MNTKQLTTARRLTHLFGSILLLTSAAAFAGSHPTVQDLQHEWAHVNYELEGKAKLAGFKDLVATADSVTQNNPDSADLWTWSGIIKSTYAGAKGGLGALSLAKAARQDLEHAIEINGNTLNGSAYASLGTLYFKVPGWPVGFGNDKKAASLLKQALALAPDSIDNNFFYAEFLRDQGNYGEAEKYLLKAMKARPRKNRPLADKGRKNDIKLALAEVRRRLGD